jgi:hypothetical protein
VTTSAGTYRIGDGAPVSIDSAQALWVSIAGELLARTARRYNAVLSETELAAEVQTRSGIRTKMLTADWIGGVLGRIADDCASRGEPMLSALCVRDDGSIAAGYGDAVERASGVRPDDIDLHAAEERLSCYRHFGAELPPDGGRPQQTRKIAPPVPPRKSASRAAPRTSTPRRQVPEKPVAICPTCFTQLPVRGRCDTCG